MKRMEKIALGLGMGVCLLSVFGIAFVNRKLAQAKRESECKATEYEALEVELLNEFIPVLHEHLGLKVEDYVSCVHGGSLMKPLYSPDWVRGETYMLHYMNGTSKPAFTTHRATILFDCLINMKRDHYAEAFVEVLAHEMCHVKQITDGRLDLESLNGVDARLNTWFEKEAYPYGKSFAKEHQARIQVIARKYSL